MLTDAAATLLAAKLKTLLQIGRHLVRAVEATYELDAKPVDVDIIEAVLSRQLDELEPRLRRLGSRRPSRDLRPVRFRWSV